MFWADVASCGSDAPCTAEGIPSLGGPEWLAGVGRDEERCQRVRSPASSIDIAPCSFFLAINAQRSRMIAPR
jgi:hypothetical protein